MSKALWSGVALAAILVAPAMGANENWLTNYAPPTSPENRVGTISRDDSIAVRPEAESAKQVIPALKGVVFVSSPGQVRKRGASANGVVAPAEVPEGAQSVAADYVGKQLTFGDLDSLSRKLVLAYRDADRPVVNVVIPEQEVSNGVLQILVVQGRLGQVKVEGKGEGMTPEVAEHIKSEIRSVPGEPISEGSILNDLRYLNSNPFLSTAAIYQPGKTFGLTDVAIMAEKSKPWMVYGGVETRGDGGPLRLYRPFVGVMANGLLGLDEVIGYQFTSGQKFTELRSHVVSLAMPLPARFRFQAIYGHMDSKASISHPLKSDGTNDIAGVYLYAPLPFWGRLSHDVRFGGEYKRTNNDLDFGGTTVTTGTAAIMQGVVGYVGELLSSYGVTRFDGNIYVSPGHVVNHNNDQSFHGLRAGTKAKYTYARGTINHQLEIFDGWKIEGSVTGQTTSHALLPSEMLQFGGPGSIRGFLSDKGRVDKGGLGNLTLYTPTIGQYIETPYNLLSNLRFYGFIDSGIGHNMEPVGIGKKSVKMTGSGIGLAYAYSTNVSVDVGYGWKVQAKGMENAVGNGAVHLRAIVRY